MLQGVYFELCQICRSKYCSPLVIFIIFSHHILYSKLRSIGFNIDKAVDHLIYAQLITGDFICQSKYFSNEHRASRHGLNHVPEPIFDALGNHYLTFPRQQFYIPDVVLVEPERLVSTRRNIV